MLRRRPPRAAVALIVAASVAGGTAMRNGIVVHEHADGEHSHVHAWQEAGPHPRGTSDRGVAASEETDGPAFTDHDHESLHGHALQLAGAGLRALPSLAPAGSAGPSPLARRPAAPPARPWTTPRPRGPPPLAPV